MERVLVLPQSIAHASLAFAHKGLTAHGLDILTEVIARHGMFLNRDDAEVDPAFKQIIPYACVRNGAKCFLLQRKKAQGEQRLHEKLSIGVGGHINLTEKDKGGDLIAHGLHREVNEELEIGAGYEVRLVGIVNDDTTDVGRVHLGVLFEITPHSPLVGVREHDKMSGRWVEMQELRQCFDSLETWSQIVCEERLFL